MAGIIAFQRALHRFRRRPFYAGSTTGPFHPDRQHLSHRITNRGWSKPGAVFWIHGLGLASGVVGVLLYTWPVTVALIVAALVIAGWLVLAGYEFWPRRQ